MTNTCTNIEQSKKLNELGLDPNTADMCWKLKHSGDNVGVCSVMDYDYIGIRIPAWSLSALLELMPNHYCIEKTSSNRYACYFLTNPEEFGSTPIEAAYKKVVWLLENKLIKT